MHGTAMYRRVFVHFCHSEGHIRGRKVQHLVQERLLGIQQPQCPSCSRRFKVPVKREEGFDVEFCPYCGIPSESGWLTDEQRAYMMGIVAEQFVEPSLREFSDKLNSIGQGGGFLRFTASYEVSERPPEPLEPEEPMATCCETVVTHDGTAGNLFCFRCGKH